MFNWIKFALGLLPKPTPEQHFVKSSLRDAIHIAYGNTETVDLERNIAFGFINIGCLLGIRFESAPGSLILNTTLYRYKDWTDKHGEKIASVSIPISMTQFHLEIKDVEHAMEELYKILPSDTL